MDWLHQHFDYLDIPEDRAAAMQCAFEEFDTQIRGDTVALYTIETGKIHGVFTQEQAEAVLQEKKGLYRLERFPH